MRLTTNNRRPRASRPAANSTWKALCLLLCTGPGLAAGGAVDSQGQPTTESLAELSLEELMEETVTVTSVSKREQKLADAAAAVTVLSNEDLRRSGMTNVADALRLVPGMNVGSVNASQWSVSARGFNNLYANKLLVLVDGRAVYSPMFAGVYWDAEQTLLEDVDRIEVIRGPGATVWGANAVNGVVNIVTRSARDTQGGLLYGLAGDVEKIGGGARYGGQLAENTYYRVFASHLTHGDHVLANGSDAGDGWQGQQGGFRIDHYPDPDTQLTWLTGATTVRSDDHQTDARNVNTLGRVQRRLANDSTFEVQAYFDQAVHEEAPRADIGTDTLDLSAQHTFALGERNDVIWGLGYRYVDVSIGERTPLLQVRDDEVKTQLFSAFVQNDFKLIPDKAVITAGVKVEHNDYTGVEVQPSLRGTYKPTERQTIWGAVSRAVRTPSGIEGKDVFAVTTGAPIVGPGGLLYVPRVVGNTDAVSETLWAYELGYRVQPNKRVSVDLAVFYNDYSDVISLGAAPRFTPGVPVGTADIPFSNTVGGHTYGGEMAVTISPTASWRLTASYSLLIAHLDGPAASNAEGIEDGSPRNQVVLRSSHDLGARWSLDAQLRYVDAIEFVPSYVTADVRVSYRASERLEFALVGQNLLQDQHLEQGPVFFATTTEVPRGFYGKLTWRF